MSGVGALIALALMMAASMAIGLAASRAAESGGFLRGYFLGNRGLGSWSMALTATVMSGGSFMGFPSLIYQYGWTLALWIASYMMVPLCTFAILGKRIGRLARETGAITLPDLLRERFRSPALGIVASAVVVFVLSVTLIAQFKAGAIILQKVLPILPGMEGGPVVADKSAAFLAGLGVFSLVVVAYTVYGGFLAAVWTDVFQSVLMAVGVLVLLPLALAKAGGLGAGTMAGIQAVGPGFAFAPGGEHDGREFLPLTLAFSFFVMWSICGMGQPATLVRLMAFRDTTTLRHATVLLALYNTLIYLPLVFVFIAARAIPMPGLKAPDEVMPTLALTVASPLVAGIILAAPFGAVMSTVSAFLVQITSALVRDLYQRFVDPLAPEARLRRLSHAGIVLVALWAAGGAIFSPRFLQAIIVFAGGANACAFLVPAILAAWVPGATARAALAAMLGGIGTVLVLYGIGWLWAGDPGIGEKSTFAPYYLLGIAPYVWGLVVSALLGLGASLAGAGASPARELAADPGRSPVP